MNIKTDNRTLIKPVYENIAQEQVIQTLFTQGGWMNATAVARAYGKEVKNWLHLPNTWPVIEETVDILKAGNPNLSIEDFVITKRGRHSGGTWLHPDVARLFAQWLDPRFAAWCNIQLQSIKYGEWRAARDRTVEYTAEMQEELELTRELDGKETQSYHYSNEERMINTILTAGDKALTKGIDRQSLTAPALEAQGWLLRLNARMIARGMSYQDRKAKLKAKFKEKNPGVANGEVKLVVDQSNLAGTSQ